MIRIIVFIQLITCFLGAQSQNSGFCYTSELMNKWLLENPEKAKTFLKLQEDATINDKTDFANNYASFRLRAATVYTIPVVFHILHLAGPENISNAQVQDAMFILNRDFRKLNADTSVIVPEFKNLAADVNFEFRLATKDEFGNCTDGIVRHYDARTNWIVDLSNYVYTWNPSMYLNVYVVGNIANAAGYTFLPGTVGAMADAIVMRHDYVGSMGTSSLFSSRALTHEVGHWFNLQHVWGSTNSPGVMCGDDGVSDTPITKGFNFCNLPNAKVCNALIVENVQNYMDYSYCSRMFTIGQAARMTNMVLSATAGRNNLHSNSNLIATGVINPISPCSPIADFCASKNELCVNTNVLFTDLSYNGTVTNWNWKFPDATNPVSTLQNPTITFSLSGLKSVSLKSSNSIGADSVTKKIVTVLAGPGSGLTNISQSFETISIPDNLWILNVPKIGAGWVLTNSVAATGNNCMMIDNYFDSPGEPALMYTPMYDITTLLNPALSFKVAYSQNSSNSNDRLRVYYSTDCANSWNTLYNKSGANLHTLGSGTVASGAFLNPSLSQWRKEVVSLSPIATANNVLLKFEFTRDSMNPGNNIFLDDINLESISGINEFNQHSQFITLAPNPATEAVFVSFDSKSSTDATIELLDITGRATLHKETVLISAGQNSFNLKIKGLSGGLYFVKIHLNGNFYIKKLIIN